MSNKNKTTTTAQIISELESVEENSEVSDVSSDKGKVSPEVFMSILNEISAAEMKEESYDSQKDDTQCSVLEVSIAPIDAKVKKTPSPRVTFVSKREAIEAIGEEKLTELLGNDYTKVLDSVDSIAKKVGEKMVNAVQAAAGMKKPSRYTTMGLKALLELKQVTCKQIHDAMVSAGCAESTARSQSQQMVQLFTALGLAVKSGGAIILNAEFNNVGAFEALAI